MTSNQAAASTQPAWTGEISSTQWPGPAPWRDHGGLAALCGRCTVNGMAGWPNVQIEANVEQQATREAPMGKSRFEAFSDGVIAIIITIMVLEMKVPHGESFEALAPLIPVFSQLRAELRLPGHLLEQSPPHAACLPQGDRADALGQPASPVLAVAGSLRHGLDGGEPLCAVPSALYGVVLLMAAIAYWILQQLIIASQGPDSLLKKAVGGDWKGKLSPVLYADRHPDGLLVAMDLPGALRPGRADLARAGPAHRERFCAKGG